MGGLRVRRPLDPKMVLYEKPLFQGQCKELLENTPSLQATEGLILGSSLRVTGGVWVGYSSENYRGEQCLLEEGDYSDSTTLFSGPGHVLRSCRFLQADFIEPAVSLNNCEEQIELVDQDVADVQQTGLVKEANAIHVQSGVWVAYSRRYFTGELFVLEKGRYSGSLDWGGKQSSPLSIRAVRREICGERDTKFMMRAYGKSCFAGESKEFVSEVADCDLFNPTSFRIIQGRWLLYDERGFCGNQFVLEEGLYPDLISFGCDATAVKSFRPIEHNFAEPSISLFSLSYFTGLETKTDLPMETMNNFFTQSLRVISGLWVAYECRQFKGRQMLLEAGEYPCWSDYSGWDTISSLRPLRQRRAYVQVQNRALGTALTVERTGDRPCPARILLRPAKHSLHTQHWVYTQSRLKSKVGKGCMSVIGGKACVGARVALWEEHGRVNQKWSLNENGTISSHLNHSLVLDQRGGSGLDKDHLILNEFGPDRVTQFWDIEVL